MVGQVVNDLRADFGLSRGELDLSVAFEVPGGTTAAILGPNGAGKSSIVAVLAGLIGVDWGYVAMGPDTWDNPGEARFVPPHRRNAGVVFQDYRLFDHLNVCDNVAFGIRAAGGSASSARRAARGLLDDAGLGPLADRSVRELSGGQAQRVAVLRAMATDPQLLVLDEPMAALDTAARSSLRRSLADTMASFDGPRLLITHDPNEAFALADYLWVVEEGKVSQHGSPAEIRSQPQTPFVAAVAGRNLLRGRISGGVIELEGSFQGLTAADTTADGPVLVTIAPNAVALHREQPSGSPRNSWPTTVSRIEPLGDLRRVTTSDPLPLAVDVTPGAVDALGLAPGGQVWASVKATEIGVQPD